MALHEELVNSINAQLDKFGEDGMAFDAWMNTVTPHVRAHADVGAFRTQARTLWLSNNKKAVKKLVRDTLTLPTIEEQRALEAGELAGNAFDHAYLMCLSRMGLHRGDTISVHGADGQLHSLTIDVEGLPTRAGAKNDKAKLLTEPAPMPPASKALTESPPEKKEAVPEPVEKVETQPTKPTKAPAKKKKTTRRKKKASDSKPSA